MAHADFVHLRVHDAFSLSEGAIKIPDLAALCAKHRMPAVGVADTGNLFGALEFSLAARATGIQPIIGCQIAVQRTDGEVHGGAGQGSDWIVLLAQSAEGYGNLLDLVSRSYLSSAAEDSPQITLADLEAHSSGLIALTGGVTGAVGRLLLEGQRPAAEAMLLQLAAIFDGRLYVELMRHGMPAEEQIESELIDLAYAHDIPLVATNEVFFADQNMYEAHDALMCIAEGTTVSRVDRRRVTAEHYFKSPAEMRELFADIPEAIDNTVVVAQRCAFMPDTHEPILPPYPKLDGRGEEEVLREMAAEGLDGRLERQLYAEGQSAEEREAVAKPYRERLQYELDVIAQMGFPGYFLIVADFIQWAKNESIPVGPGRGSGAGSVVAWALTITDLDPLRFGLLFERFLNPERVSMPDFDIDFCKDRRDDVIRYVQNEYGADRVAQIITFGKLEARAVLRDVGRVLEMPYGQVDRISKLVPYNPANPVSLKKALADEPLLQEMRDDDPTVGRLVDVSLKLEGLYRHASTHAAGVVIGDRPLHELVPLYRDSRSTMPVTQFNMKYVEQAGLVKFDFLGLKTLTVLSGTVRRLRDRGIDLALDKIPLDDAKTFEMLCRADSTGVFQLESSGLRDVLKKLKPDRFEDIIAVVALYRPGPMDNIPSFIKRKHGEETPDYLHESLEGILKETYGIMIYQEQVMQIAQTLSGFTLGDADLLRRAMGKKIQSEMDAQRQNFVEGAVGRDVEEDLAGRIFDQVAKFAGYGFNKSHAAAYALVAYQTAYLKANYPVEFIAASMSEDMGNTDKLGLFRAELDHMGIALLPPNINKSGVDFTVEVLSDEESAVRYALAALKNVGGAAMETVVAERTSNGPYQSVFDFAGRLDTSVLNKRQVENLTRAGAFDSLNPNRHQVYDAVEMLVRHANAAQNDRESNQVNLFGVEDTAAIIPPLPDVEDWAVQERLQQEFEAVGFYLSSHPLASYRKTCEKLGVKEWIAVTSGRMTEGRIKLAGIVSSRRFTTSSRGAKMAFVQMSDASGAFEVTVFSEVLAVSRELLESGAPLIATVDVQRWNEGFRLTAQDIQPLDEAAVRAAAGLRVFMRDKGPIDSLVSVFREHGERGPGKVRLMLEADDREIEMDLPQSYAISVAVRSAVKAIPGVIDVQDL
ncbi:MAG: DNA polymerase III subunit alpha [Alphaproteobacteria bacterium]|nr:DNA polymerase III subunit alpha [Alphaproteobacteria bacterium]